MPREDVVYFSHRRQSYRRRSAVATDRTRCCCTPFQWRAYVLILLSAGLICIYQLIPMTSFVVVLGSIGIFIGVFLILLDLSVFLQNKRMLNHRRRFGARDEEGDRDDIWTTSRRRMRQSLPLHDSPPDYATTMGDPDRFPFPAYLQDGAPSSLTTSTSPDLAETRSENEEDPLPTYAEAMNENGGRNAQADLHDVVESSLTASR